MDGCNETSRGDLFGPICTLYEMTERKHVEEKLRTSEIRFRELADSINKIPRISEAEIRM